jgi:NADH:ubiquinone oxidoreductase subunit 6 (subunit J)
MYTLIKDALQDWNLATDSRRKLQHTYLLLAISLLFIAGVVGLINYELGQRVLFIAILAGAMFVINAIAWALLQSFILLRIGVHEASVKAVEKTSARVNKKPSVKK